MWVLQHAVSGCGWFVNKCDKCATDVGSLKCTWIDGRAALAGPACPCAAVWTSSMHRRSALPSVHRSGACGHLGAPCAPVGSCRHGGGHGITAPAEIAGVRELGGWGPGAGFAEPEVILARAEAILELQQAFADVAPVVSAERLLL